MFSEIVVTFQKVFKHARNSTETATYSFLQLAEALEYLHKARVCHLDIKPNNVLFNSNDPLSHKVR